LTQKILPKGALKEMALIVIVASIIGLGANFINPKGVTLSARRPALETAPDSVFATELPAVDITDESSSLDETDIGESLIVNTSQVRQLIERNQAVLLDARSKKEYREGHIPNSINLPFETFEDHPEKVGALPDNKWLVCFCDGPPCDLGELLAFELMQMGFNRVVIYQEGLNAWKKSGGKMEGLADER